MPSIDTWLATLGLEKYASIFEAAEVDFDTLQHLIEDDLKELDLPLGPRRKIWNAIEGKQGARDNSSSGGSLGSADAHAERRHLTVMFVDLVGSTEMAARLDAEDMRTAISDYQTAVVRQVDAFDGFVANFMGDGVLCFFGWPHANEDDTARAVRAGLSIIQTVKKMTAPDGVHFATRIGVATGVVIVGDLIGNEATQEIAAVGETTNLAARLQGIANVNQLVVPSDALPLLGRAFDVVPIGSQELKGVGREVDAFVVDAETVVESRFAARSSGALTPIVGRDRELNVIQDRWSSVRSGFGRMVLLSGEAGIGKSRIVQAFVDAVSADAYSRITYQCSPYHSESAFYPFIQQMSYGAGLTPEDTIHQRLAKMEAMVDSDPKTNALMALLLGIDGTGRYGVMDTSPTQQRAQLMKAIVGLLLDKARDAPLLLVFEDLHWIDPTSLEILDSVLEAIDDQQIMVLATARPSFQHDFGAGPMLQELRLSRLDKDMAYAIVAKMTGGMALPEGIMRIIAQRTDGVPLFVEELTKTILESEAIQNDAGRNFTNKALSDIAIPATLHDSLMARLDRLGPIKEIAQIASCIGREFSYELLADTSPLTKPELDAALEQLVAAELIHRGDGAPRAHYVFKHALVRDAAYNGLLKERRILFHQRILNALELNAGAAPELLATHAEAAELTDRAIALWEAAGAAAIARPAYKEGAAHVRRAVVLNAPKVAAGDKDALAKAVALKVQLFVALTPEKGLWGDETVATLEEALALAEKAGENPQKGDILYGLLLSTYFRGNLERNIARADELKGIANATGDLAQLLVAIRLAAIGRLKTGRFEEAQPYLDEAEQLCISVADQDLAARFGHDPIVAVQIYQSLNATFRGKTIRADTYKQEAEKRARDIGHTNTRCAMLGIAVTCAHLTGDIAEERRHLELLRFLIEEHAVTASRVWAEASFALLKMAEGDATSLGAYHEAETTMLEANIRILVPGNRVVAGRRAMVLGLKEDARELVDSAERLMNETGEKSWLPEVFRVRAEFALDDGNHKCAEKHLVTALDVARRNGGGLWALRSAIDLATLYKNAGRTKEAIGLLHPICDSANEGDCPEEMLSVTRLMKELGAVS